MLHEFCRLPEKSAFKIEEVCGLTGLKPYTLKFWESDLFGRSFHLLVSLWERDQRNFSRQEYAFENFLEDAKLLLMATSGW